MTGWRGQSENRSPASTGPSIHAGRAPISICDRFGLSAADARRVGAICRIACSMALACPFGVRRPNLSRRIGEIDNAEPSDAKPDVLRHDGMPALYGIPTGAGPVPLLVPALQAGCGRRVSAAVV
jgi:hypothetical protein